MKLLALRFSAASAALLALAGCRRTAQSSEPAPPPEVLITQPILKDVFEYEILPGRVEAIDDVDIKARVTGTLEQVNFIEGSEVKAGDPLFEINPREYQARLESAKAGVERVKASTSQADLSFKRAVRLRSTNAISQEEFEVRETELLNSKSNLRAAEADVDRAELDLEYTKISSPIDGKISSLVVTRGNLISVGDLLTTVVRQAPVYVTFEVPERSVLRWDQAIRKVGEKRLSESVIAEVGLLSEEGFPHQAKVDFVDNSINPATATLRVRAILENADRSARVGLYARVRLSLKRPEKTLLIPERAVGTDQGQRFVYLLDENDTVVYQKVVPGQIHDGMLSISDGLTPQDRVITEGLLTLKAGMNVKPTQAEVQ